MLKYFTLFNLEGTEKNVPKYEVKKPKGTEAKPSEAGLVRRGETKTQLSFEIEISKRKLWI